MEEQDLLLQQKFKKDIKNKKLKVIKKGIRNLSIKQQPASQRRTVMTSQCFC